MIECLTPNWDAPTNVRALSTTRSGGVSEGPFASLNLAGHVGDDPERVQLNRDRLIEGAEIPTSPCWLNQVHGCEVHEVRQGCAVAGPQVSPPEADAAVAFQPQAVCVVMAADCLPVLLCDEAGRAVAAAHAGWRGLAAGVIERTVARMGCGGERLLAWLGPAIGPQHFEVGDEVRATFCQASPAAEAAFRPSARGRWLADLPLLARQRLQTLGVQRITGAGACTFSDAARFYSYRRDGCTGRMASLIWLDA